MTERLRPRQQVSIDEALVDPNLLGAALGNSKTWETWLTILRAAFGLPLTQFQRETFGTISGNRNPPAAPVKELWAVVGRRSGKSRMAGALAVHAALLQSHQYLAPGETGYVLVLSPTLAQANVVFSYARGFIESSPVLRQEIVSLTAHEIRLRSGIVIATHANSFRSVRGKSLIQVIFDESSFFRDETSANPDVEAYRAVMPALATTGGMLIGISTPYRKLGLLHQRHKDFFGADDPDVLVVQGDSRTFNPTLDTALIAKATADDPQAAIAEWAGVFRPDIGAFLNADDIDACVDINRPGELPPQAWHHYMAFVDPSGGRHDAMTLCIGHGEDDRVIIDALRGQSPPFDPKATTKEYAALLREYGCREVVGDNYAASWVETEFKAAGIKYLRSDLPKGRLYLEGLPFFTRRTVSLPNHPRLVRELRLLERRPSLAGKEIVDHGRSGSDDYANSVFGVLHGCAKPKPRIVIGYASASGFGPIAWDHLREAPRRSGVVFRTFDEQGVLLKEDYRARTHRS